MGNNRPRILYVTSCWPHDRSYGGQLRALHIGRALQQLGRPTIAVIGADPVGSDSIARTAAEFELGQEIKVRPSPVLGLRNRLKSIFSPDFTNLHGLAAHPDDERWLIEAQTNFDLIWFFKLRTANMLTRARWRNAVVDIDDVPSTMERSFWKNGATARIRFKAGLRMLMLQQHERRLPRRFDVLSVCSKADRGIWSSNTPVHIIPNGFARPNQRPTRNPTTPPRIGFMGLYNYEPNYEGVRWFIEHCWPRILREIPDARLRLVGAETDGPLKPNLPSVDGLGWVENPADEVASWSATIVPIRTGAGTRVKIPDAFSRRCPVVSTRLGAFGYDVQHGRELLIADEPDDFAEHCMTLIKNRNQADEQADRAYEAFLEKWTWDAITPKVLATADDCLRRNAKQSQWGIQLV